MPRKKRTNPLLIAARSYLSLHAPDLKAASLRVRMLDGPPGAPICAVAGEACQAADCPSGVPAAVAESGQCPVRDCPLRCSVRLLLDRRGVVVQDTRSSVHWN